MSQPAPRVYYQDEAVTLWLGDCLDVLPQLGPVDHVITDPPYSRDLYLRFRTNRKGPRSEQTGHDDAKARREIQNGAIGAIDDILTDVAAQVVRLSRRWIVIFHDAEIGHRWREALNGHYVRAGVWVKPNAVPQISGDRPGQGFESITIGHAKGAKRWNSGGHPAVWTVCGVNSQSGGRVDHPCPKPIPLMTELLADFTDEGDTILDPFAGSGTTGVAAKLNGRKAILIEREEKYCEVAAKRLRETEPGRLFDKLPKAKPQSLLTEESA